MKSILKKSGELGLMGISIPEEYGGFGQYFVTQMLAAETIGAGYSFSVALHGPLRHRHPADRVLRQ